MALGVILPRPAGNLDHAAVEACVLGAVSDAQAVEHRRQDDLLVTSVQGDGENLVTINSDPKMGLTWVTCCPAEGAGLHAIRAALAGRFGLLDYPALMVEAGDGLAPNARLRALALLAPAEADARLAAEVASALADPDADIRAETAISAALIGWDSLIALLEQAQRREPDAGVQATLAGAVLMLKSAGPTLPATG